MSCEQLMESGRFLKELYYRLSVIVIAMPPLREVRREIPKLIWHFLRRVGERERRGPPAISSEAVAALVAAPWQGNCRQLFHELQRAALLSSWGEIRVEH